MAVATTARCHFPGGFASAFAIFVTKDLAVLFSTGCPIRGFWRWARVRCWHCLFTPFAMHGSYTHRVTCNLYPHQHELLTKTAQSFGVRLAPFLRDTAIAYCQRRTMLPDALQKRLRQMIQEIRRVGTNLNQMAAHANSFQRVTHQDLRNAGKLVLTLERLVSVLQKTLEALPHDHQVHVA